MKAIIAGGRDVRLGGAGRTCLAALRAEVGFAEVVCGGASGVDADAAAWAEDEGLAVSVFPADWSAYGRAAGPIRNRQMLDYVGPDGLLIAFPGGKGTANIMKQARARGVRVIEVG